MKKTAKIEPGLVVVVVLLAAIGVAVVGTLVFDVSPDRTSLPPEYQYDIAEYAQIDPALIRYQLASKPMTLDFEQPRGIAVGADGIIFVVGDKKVASYRPGRGMLAMCELDVEPTCVVEQMPGVLVVGAGSEVLFIEKMGMEVGRFSVPSEKAVLTSLAINEENVFAADAVNKLVWRLDKDGKVLGKIGERNPDRNIPGIIVPSPYFDILMASDGLLRVVNPGRHVIAAYTVDGHREWAWGKASMGVEGFSGCCNPVALAMLPDGGFVTAEKGLVRVKTYDADGNFTGVVAGPEQLGWTGPVKVCQTPAECRLRGFDVAISPTGRVYVLDMGNRVIRIFEKK